MRQHLRAELGVRARAVILHFARALQQELARRGHPWANHVIDQWDASRDERFDVVVHLKGLTTYEPNPAQVNLLWSISHPEKLTVEGCERSNLVLVASERFAAELRERCSVPVHVLEQATDPRCSSRTPNGPTRTSSSS